MKTFGEGVRLAALLCIMALALRGRISTATARESPAADPDIATIDTVVREWLASTGAPSVSIALVRGGKVAYAQAYGYARLAPRVAATATTRYPIDSVSKEFTAAAVLLLAEAGRLSLDDPAGKWYADLGEASAVTLRQLLTHTSGIRDYWPQDFVPPEMLRPTSTARLLAEWAARPLDFAPGTDWQYSNTGYALAGAVVEKASGQPLMQFLQERVFKPLQMTQVMAADAGALRAPDAQGYTRFGLGPLREAPHEGAGWLFGAAQLAMSPTDLARWDVSLIEQSLLSSESYEAERARVVLKDGSRRDYGLGLDIEERQGRSRIGHDGAGSGFLAANRIWPEDRIAIVALTNNDWASPDELIERLAYVLLPPKPEEARAREIFAGFQRGTVDRAVFTDAGNSYLTAANLADLKASLAPLGPARLIVLERETHRGGMLTRRWKILCRGRRLEAVERGYPDGKLEQFIVSERGD